jgi:putative transcriptional regulator
MTTKLAMRKQRSSTSVGRSLLRGLRQAVAYERGQLKGRVQVYNVPPRVDVCRVRAKTGLSQAEFASRYGFNPRSLQDWEQSRRMPDSAARAYLLVIENNPKAVEEAFLRRAS